MISQPSSTSSVTQTAAKVDARVQPTQPQVMPAVESGPMPIFTMKPASKGKPPTHLADLDQEGRKKAMKEAGFPAFRADQLSRHYFERHEVDPEAMSDLPAKVPFNLIA